MDRTSSDSVTCSLQEYQALFRQAHLQELKYDGEKERRELRQDLERQKKELHAERESLSTSSAMREERVRVLPGNWQLVNHTANGQYHFGSEPEERSMATYEFALDFRIFEDEWTAIPVIDAQTIVADWTVTREVVGNGSTWEDVELGRNTLLVLKRRLTSEAEQLWQDHTFVTNSSGRYRIHFRAFTYVRNNRNLFNLQLNLLYPLAQTQLRLFHDSAVGHIRELNVEPAAFFDVLKTESYSDINIRLPSSSVVEIKWRMQLGAGAQSSNPIASALQGADQVPGGREREEDNQPAQATVLHDSLHSIADGIIQSTHTFKYHLDSAAQSLSSVEIIVLSPARVSSVLAHGMQTWRTGSARHVILPGQSSDTSASAGDVSGTAVVVVFKSSVISKEVIVKVNTEQEFDVQDGLVTLPVAICQGVLRQTGTLAVVKLANVEVYEQLAAGVASIGSDDIPSYIRGVIGRPIVLAYKYLSPRYNVTISVIHHEELRTLEAVADAALHRVLVVDTQVMHSFMMVLQNTQRQYMELRGIPDSATLWSLKVNSLDTKPVRGRGGSLMVPLLVDSGGNVQGGSISKTSIELAWLSTCDPLGQNGTIDLSPPQVDVPISALSVEVQFPSSYVVNFTGSVVQVDRFSQQQPSRKSYETTQEVTGKDFDFGAMPPPGSAASGSHGGVKAKVPKMGKRYLFEKLLVVNGSATLSVAYGQPPSNETIGLKLRIAAKAKDVWNRLFSKTR